MTKWPARRWFHQISVNSKRFLGIFNACKQSSRPFTTGDKTARNSGLTLPTHVRMCINNSSFLTEAQGLFNKILILFSAAQKTQKCLSEAFLCFKVSSNVSRISLTWLLLYGLTRKSSKVRIETFQGKHIKTFISNVQGHFIILMTGIQCL